MKLTPEQVQKQVEIFDKVCCAFYDEFMKGIECANWDDMPETDHVKLVFRGAMHVALKELANRQKGKANGIQ